MTGFGTEDGAVYSLPSRLIACVRVYKFVARVTTVTSGPKNINPFGLRRATLKYAHHQVECISWSTLQRIYLQKPMKRPTDGPEAGQISERLLVTVAATASRSRSDIVSRVISDVIHLRIKLRTSRYASFLTANVMKTSCYFFGVCVCVCLTVRVGATIWVTKFLLFYCNWGPRDNSGSLNDQNTKASAMRS